MIFTKTLPALHNLRNCPTQRTLLSLFMKEMTSKMLSPQSTRCHTACVAFPSKIFVSETVEDGRRLRRRRRRKLRRQHCTQRKKTTTTMCTVRGDTERSDKEREPVWQEHHERHDEHGTGIRHEPRHAASLRPPRKCNNGASICGLQCHHEHKREPPRALTPSTTPRTSPSACLTNHTPPRRLRTTINAQVKARTKLLSQPAGNDAEKRARANVIPR